MTGADVSWVLAIDFGTSYTVVASRVDGRAPEVIEVDGDRRIPSVLMIADDGRFVIGRAAEEMAAALPTRVLRACKTRLGDPSPIVLGGRPYQATSLVAELLVHVYEEAVRVHDCPPSSARLTYPATWSGQRRQRLLRAAELAGLPSPTLVPEPIAAAIWYSDIAEVPRGSHVVVYDLGGGTLDCALVKSGPAGLELVGRPSGERQLGGELFDELLANAIGERLPADVWESLQLGDEQIWRQAWVGLLREARRAKELLSSQPHADILVSLPRGFIELRVGRAELEAVIRPHLIDSVQVLKHIVADAGLGPNDLHAIYLVGGASRTPMVEALITDAFPLTPIAKRADPKTVVALGATSGLADGEHEAWVLPHERITDPAPHREVPPAVVADAAPHRDGPPPVPEGDPAPDPDPDLVVGRAQPSVVAAAPARVSGHSTVADGATGPPPLVPPDEGTVRREHGPDRRRRRRVLWLSVAALGLLVAAAVVVLVTRSDDEPVDPGLIVFASDRDGDFELFTMNPDGTDQRQITTNDKRDTFPAWSADATKIAWTQDGDIVVAAADGSSPINLTADIETNTEKPAWTPDGSTIVFVSGDQTNFEIWKMSVTGEAKTLLVSFSAKGHPTFDPRVSADGELFYSYRDTPTHVELCRTEMDEGACHPVLPANASNVTDEVIALAPDGHKISFSRSLDAVSYDVMVTDLDGGAVIDVTLQAEPADVPDTAVDPSLPVGPAPTVDPAADTSSNDYGSSWSPDATSLAMIRQLPGDDTEIWVVDGDDTFHQLTDNAFQDLDPDWGVTGG